MLLADRTTLVQFLIEERRRFPEASGELNAVILDVALACKAIARAVAHGALAGMPGAQPGETHTESIAARVAQAAGEIFVYSSEWGGHLAGMLAADRATPLSVPPTYPKGKYLLLFDAVDRPANLEVNLALGSLFSVLRAPRPGVEAAAADFLQPGTQQICAGYAIYGPVTMLVLTVGDGVAGFTLDHSLGEFKLTHPSIRVPVDCQEFAINTSNSRFWESPIKRYVDECLAGKTGSREKDFNMRWIASLVAEAHRILMRGGVFMYPRDTKDPSKPGRLRLLYEANPIGFVMEQAGGRASTGREPVLAVAPAGLHQRIGLVFGSKNEVERIERYHAEAEAGTDKPYVSPLFNERSLYRPEARV